jgi:Leucine-rich repeat (LRR) protein
VAVPLLFGLPADIAGRILFQFLNLNQLTRLDIALCSPKQLADIMSASKERDLSGEPKIQIGLDEIYIAWAVSRCVQVSYVPLQPALLTSPRLEQIVSIATNLKILALSGGMEINGRDNLVSPFAHTLVELRLHRCALSQFHEALSSCPNLKQLILSSCRGSWSMQGNGLPRLENLLIYGKQWDITWTNTCEVPMPNLQALALSGLPISSEETKEVVLAVGSGGNLGFLELSHVHGVDKVVPGLTQRNQRITYFILQANLPAGGDYVVQAFVAFRWIRHLELSNLGDIPHNLLHLIGMCTTLTSLDLSNNNIEFSSTLSEALGHLIDLKLLNLSGCTFDTSVDAMLRWCKRRPEELHLNNVRVSNDTIDTIVQIGSKLRVLNISCPPRVMSDMFTSVPPYTAAGVKVALRNLPELRQLGIDLPVQREWVTAYPRVRITRLSPKQG